MNCVKKKMKSEVKHIYFDLDHTLWDFDTNSRLTLQEMYVAFKMDKIGFENFDVFHKTYLKVNQVYWSWYRNGKITKEQLRVGRFRDTLLERDFSDDILVEQLQSYYVKESPEKAQLMPGAIEVLEHIWGRYELHIITNGFKEVQNRKLENSKISHYFRNVIISEETGFQKPDVRIFRHAERESGSTPGNSLMIGDSFEADILGATRAGWDAIHLLEANENASKLHGVRYIRNLTKLLEML